MFKLYYEPISCQYFVSTPEKIERAINELNHKLVLDRCVSFNYWLKCLGIGLVKNGDEFGWGQYIGEIYYGYIYVDIIPDEFLNKDGRTYINLFYVFSPTFDYKSDEPADCQFFQPKEA